MGKGGGFPFSLLTISPFHLFTFDPSLSLILCSCRDSYCKMACEGRPLGKTT
jgi:hypothetical protein